MPESFEEYVTVRGPGLLRLALAAGVHVTDA